MKTSLIVTTYNWKEALELVFRSIARQSELPDEVIIADDGSRPDTGELVQSWAGKLPVPVIHVWQEDEGFRAARARNRALAASSGDYIIYIDGDMILQRNFIEDHKRAAKPGVFIQGVRVITEPPMRERILNEGLIDVGFFTPNIKRRRHTLRSYWLSKLASFPLRTDQKAIRSCNQGYWRADLLRVNGWNEALTGWGREDNEIAARMYNSGIKRRNLKFAALAMHIYHPVRHPQGENPNDRLLRETIENRLTRCERGLDMHLKESTMQPEALTSRPI